LQQSLRNLDTAYKNFLDSCAEKRQEKKVSQPRFKNRTNSQSAEFTKAALSMNSETVYLAKIGEIKPIFK
jgi:putative transposase